MKVPERKLIKKGWAEEEIERVKGIIQKAEERKNPGIYLLERFSYWFAIILILAGTFVFSLVLIPLIMGASTLLLYAVIILFGLGLGSFFVILIQDVEHINIKHHVFHSIVIPVVAIVNLFFVVSIANGLVKLTNLGHIQSKIWISLTYVIALLIPYVFGLMKKPR
ncbi:MAG: hypothetical protein V1659_02070 [Candidatus Woesearchaeota archaeon]